MNIERNGLIELYRFIFIIMIMSMHFLLAYYQKTSAEVILGGGYICVEFFFVLTGFFLGKWAQDPRQRSITSLLFKYLRKLYPLYLFTTILAIGHLLVTDAQYHINLFDIIANVVLLSPYRAMPNAPAWFFCAMIWILPLLCYLLKHYSKLMYAISPYICLVIYSMIYMDIHHLDVWWQWGYLSIPIAFFRAAADMLMGVILYAINYYIDLNSVTIRPNFIVICEIIIFLVLIKMMVSPGHNELDFCAPLLFMLLILFAFMMPERILKKFQHKCLYSLGKLSVVLFLSHFTIMKIVLQLARGGVIEKIFTFILCSVLWSMALSLIIKKMEYYGNRLIYRFVIK